MVQKTPDTADTSGRRGRGRPRGFDTGQALNAAQASFWRAGYAATSLDTLAEATGLNRPSLYGAFGDKRALYLAALAKSADESVASLAAALAARPTVREALALVYDSAIRIYLAGERGPQGCFIIGTAVVEALGDAAVREALAGALTRMDGAFEARFAAARSAGELPAEADPRGLALIASAVLNNLAIRARAGLDRATLQAVARAGVDALCGPA
ncbi:TetR/AcrR family transcriptional regulator [Caulobacter sp. KR2-114]|uniref:TetR/AcrR family transcriptional regulator n=1 Tax=Caulobacter sp. KR2-114 TaxID=3400912 RepID=UPI003C0FB89E